MLFIIYAVCNFFVTDILSDKYIVQEVPMDGNCLFSALAAGLGVSHTAQSVRAQVVDYAANHMEEV